MKQIAEFDKPYDATLLMLKDELQANSIEFFITGENGNNNPYMAVTFEIGIMVDESDYETAMSILGEVRKKQSV